jgi:hypothetical protein
MERFSFEKLNKVGAKEKQCIEISNKFAALEDLNTEAEINSAWK